jgi:hypothetical protein
MRYAVLGLVVWGISSFPTVADEKEDQEFRQKAMEKRVLSSKLGDSLAVNNWVCNLAQFPTGYTSLIKAYDVIKKHIKNKKATREQIDEWYGCLKVCIRELVRHSSVKKDPSLFPDKCFKYYFDEFLVGKEFIEFAGKLGPRAKAALPRLREIEQNDCVELALAAHKAIKKIQAKK